MALSDACFDFLHSVADAANVLADAVHHYAAPGYPISYGGQIDALRRACAAFREHPYDASIGSDLLRLAASVMTFHGTPPNTPEHLRREAEMKKLVSLLQGNLDPNDSVAVPAVIGNVVSETQFTPQAAERLKSMLAKLGKSTYEIAIKIISDIGSATVKKMLGL
jgi:hypothetical protein